MAFFGYPEAHDNDAERAARAALAILDAIAQLNEDAARPKLSARIGIDSGPVVVGPGAGTQPDVFGTRRISRHGCRRQRNPARYSLPALRIAWSRDYSSSKIAARES